MANETSAAVHLLCNVLPDLSAYQKGWIEPDTKPRREKYIPKSPKLADLSKVTMYFLAGAGLIKIGITTNMVSRIRSIRNSSPVPLDLIGEMPGCTLYEGFAHHRFRHLRRHGEWFVDDGEIRAFLASGESIGTPFDEALHTDFAGREAVRWETVGDVVADCVQPERASA
jgi:hypothetical protein